MALAVAGLLSLGCIEPAPQAGDTFQVHRAPDPSSSERYCAWFAEAGDGTLYFGQSAFWTSYRAAGGDPRAVLQAHGPRLLGRFDLRGQTFLEPIDLGTRQDGTAPRSGVWDVLPVGHRVYFTTYFEEAGYLDVDSGKVTLLPHGQYWNELALGPVVTARHGFSTTAESLILVTRYADADSGGGAVVLIDPDGVVVAEHSLEAPADRALAPKTPAFDPIREEIWVTTDLLPLPANGDERASFAHPTVVLDLKGREVGRFGSTADPAEIQFVRFNAQGLGYIAMVRGSKLTLVVLEPGSSRSDLSRSRQFLLDDRFSQGLDFVQDIQIAADGSAIVTRWSGRVHQVNPGRGGGSRTWQFPQENGALYYTAVAGEGSGQVCATRCGDVEIVCSTPRVAGKR